MANRIVGLGRGLVVGLGLLALTGCQDAGDEGQLATLAQPLLLDPDFDGDGTLPASDYTLFEADPVRPVVTFAESSLVAVTNTNNDTLELLRPKKAKKGKKALEVCGSVRVGLRPVAAAVISETDKKATLWVVNHLSDSISVVAVKVSSCKGEVVDTLHVGDEPRDIVLAEQGDGSKRVFVTTAHRGQHHPVDSARSGHDLVTAPPAKQAPGLADVFVFDPSSPSAALEVINLFTDTPRALAVGDGVVYAAGFHTGNRTVTVPADTAARRGVMSLLPLLAKDDSGQPIEVAGQLQLLPGVSGVVPVQGGMAAVSGSGRCMPDPRQADGSLFDVGVCVKTDQAHRVESVHVVTPGTVDPECQCTSGDGTPQPTTSVIVQFEDNMVSCGPAFTVFPDGTAGCWLDAPLGGTASPAEHAGSQSPAMAFNDDVRLSLPDQDVFAIDVNSLEVTRAYSGVGTILFGMAVQPTTGDVLVLGTEAKNRTRFEGAGETSSTTVRGHLHESQITRLGPSGTVQPVHLNTHIDYAICCGENPQENEQSLAFPTAGAISPDGQKLFFTLLGSDKVAALDVSALGAGFDQDAARASGALSELYVGSDVMAPSGPVGLALSQTGDRLYVKTHFSNEVLQFDTASGSLQTRISLPTPEPASITDGRHVLYNARLTSSHGDSACASCHVFGNFDSLAWDLGDPDGETVKNPGPFSLAPEQNFVGEIAVDPTFVVQTPDFRSNKGPMTTQTLRGMANHGAQHWRGDRTRNFQDAPGEQPNFGTLNEDNSFGEFDVAIAGLNGKDSLLEPEVFQAFTNFSLQLTLPPNPVRALDDSLTPEQAAGRAMFFGCQSQSGEQFQARECTGLSGQLVDVDTETHACTCFSNIFVRALDGTAAIAPFSQITQGIFANPVFTAQFIAIASDTTGLPPEAVPVAGALAAQLELAIQGFVAADLSLESGMFKLPGAVAFSSSTGALLAVLGFSAQFGTPVAANAIGFLLSAVPPEATGPGSPFESPEAFVAALPQAFAVSNLTIRARQDELAAGTRAFRDLLNGCEIGTPKSCDLRVSDSILTCNGCHSLNPAGNAEFDVFRPGFFGTSGRYSFENESQVFKVPHLRNLYAKVGMFGMAPNAFVLPESILGPESGGFFAPGTSQYQGPQVRGTGFLHDGAVDTAHRFFGAGVFAARPSNGIDPGNPGGFEAVLPVEATQATCVSVFRNAPLGSLPPLDPELLNALAFCSASSGLPDSCFLEPAAPDCQLALALYADQLGDPTFPTVFVEQIRLACFQLGSVLEGGGEGGVCAPQGLKERSNMEAFVMAFDTNLKPMVGQQVTLSQHPSAADEALLQVLVAGAARGDCDLTAFQENVGYVVTKPNPAQPKKSGLVRTKGKPTSLGKLLGANCAPLTLTCYPPQPGRAEAFRAIQ